LNLRLSKFYMGQLKSFHILTVGHVPPLMQSLWDRIAARGGYRISHIAHPSYDQRSWPRHLLARDVFFFRDDIRSPIPAADCAFLASLEEEGAPTVHNMIMSDRVVCRLPYPEAIDYAGLLAQRLVVLYKSVQPDVVIGGFDSMHGSLGFAVARHIGIPWFALLFSPLSHDEAALCADLSPASGVVFDTCREAQLRAKAEGLLEHFLGRKIEAAAYIPPRLFSAAFIFGQIPAQIGAFVRVLRRRRLRQFLKYTDNPKSYSLSGIVGEAFRLRKNLWCLDRRKLLERPVAGRFAFLGLHMQPESSIDVFAPFFSNQERVIELIARSMPPTHALLIKLHKSDVPNYSPAQLVRLSRIPGVQLVSPYADTYEFIQNAELVFSIQGTIGLEGALMGRPVIIFGDSPVKIFPSVSTIGKITDLPALVRQKIAEQAPARARIVAAFTTYLSPFYPASANDWNVRPTDAQIENYVRLFGLLKTRFGEAQESVLLRKAD
jgi:hypothetical protein